MTDTQRAREREELLNMKNGDEVYFNMFQDGGAKVILVNYDTYVLFEVPLYGGNGVLETAWQFDNKSRREVIVNRILDIAYSWT